MMILQEFYRDSRVLGFVACHGIIAGDNGLDGRLELQGVNFQGESPA